jgi:hypothetical protein
VVELGQHPDTGAVDVGHLRKIDHQAERFVRDAAEERVGDLGRVRQVDLAGEAGHHDAVVGGDRDVWMLGHTETAPRRVRRIVTTVPRSLRSTRIQGVSASIKANPRPPSWPRRWRQRPKSRTTTSTAPSSR